MVLDHWPQIDPAKELDSLIWGTVLIKIISAGLEEQAALLFYQESYFRVCLMKAPEMSLLLLRYYPNLRAWRVWSGWSPGLELGCLCPNPRSKTAKGPQATTHLTHHSEPLTRHRNVGSLKPSLLHSDSASHKTTFMMVLDVVNNVTLHRHRYHHGRSQGRAQCSPRSCVLEPLGSEAIACFPTSPAYSEHWNTPGSV